MGSPDEGLSSIWSDVQPRGPLLRPCRDDFMIFLAAAKTKGPPYEIQAVRPALGGGVDFISTLIYPGGVDVHAQDKEVTSMEVVDLRSKKTLRNSRESS